MSGKHVIATLLAILLATVVVPPTAAWVMNRRRVNRAGTDVARLASALEHDLDRLRQSAETVDVLQGPGRVPVTETGGADRWTASARGNLTLGDEAVPVDPWGNCYLVNVGALRGTESAALWIVSAGPNGIIEIPFLATTTTAAGDDIVHRVR